MRGEARKVAGPILRQVDSLASEHFLAEERLMESIRLPGLAEHRARHKELGGKTA
jgi:hemerythrin